MLSYSKRSVIRTLFHYPEARAGLLRPTAWLDGLRGVAAFEVLIYHYHLQFLGYDHNPAYGSRPDTYQWWRLPFIRNLYHSGHTMVNVFFLISGFVLTQRSLGLIRSRDYDKLYPSISSAVFRRALRIYLPAIGVTFIGMVLGFIGLRASPEAPLDNLPAQLLDWIYANRDFVQPFHNYNNPWELYHKYEAVMWTLPLEVYGSMVCYLTVMAVARVTHPVKRTAVVLIVAWFAFVKANWWSLNFLIGMLHADFMVWQNKNENEKSWSRSVVAKCFWGVILVWCLYVAGLPDAKYEQYELPGFNWYYLHTPASWVDVEDGGRFWWLIAGCTMTFCISQLPILRKLFEIRACQYLGRISFMLYLVHMYTYNLVGGRFRIFMTNIVGHEITMQIEGVDTQNVVAEGNMQLIVYLSFWVFMLPLVFFVAGQATRWIDDPSIRFAKWLEGRVMADDRERDAYAAIPLQ